VSHTTVRRLWDAYGVRPRRFDALPSRADPVPAGAPWDLVGLSLNGSRALLAVSLRPTPSRPTTPALPGETVGGGRLAFAESGIAAVDSAFSRPRMPTAPTGQPTDGSAQFLRFVAGLGPGMSGGTNVRVLATPPELVSDPRVARWRVRHPMVEVAIAADLGSWKQLAERELARLGRAGAPGGKHRGRAELVHSLARSILAYEPGSPAFEWVARRSELGGAGAAYGLRYELAATGHPGLQAPPPRRGNLGESAGLDEKRRLSARRILRDSLRVRPGERVTIEAWTGSLEYANAFVLESWRLGARPLLLYQDEPTYWAATTELSPRAVAALGEHRRAALERTDAFVSFFGPSDRERFHSLPSVTRNRLWAYQDSLYDAAARAGARAVQMAIGRVSEASARMHGVSAGPWRDELLEATLVDPKLLRRRASVLARALAKGKELSVAHPNGTALRLRLKGRPPFVSDGFVRKPTAAGDWSLVTLPAGVVTVAVDESFAEGEFRANLRSSGGLSDTVGEFEGGHWTFAHGRLTRFDYQVGQELFAQSYARDREGRDRPASLSIGINERILSAPLLEDQGLGTISMHLGRNDHVGGTTHSDWWAWLFLRGGTLRVDGRTLVASGRVAK
jgi:leucyl aminopeptidase (aminopeptidase T)